MSTLSASEISPPAHVVSINVGTPSPAPWAGLGYTSIRKHQVSGPVFVRKLGIEGDQVSDTQHHGGPDQAVYVFAREDLDWWAKELGAPLADGMFGENLTLVGMDVNAAEVGEHWAIGDALFEVASVRTPCNDFKNWIGLRGYDNKAWVRRFTQVARPGPYLRVIEEGEVTVGDQVRVTHRPGHRVTVSTMFKALNTHRELLPLLGKVDHLAQGPHRKLVAYLQETSSRLPDA
jgi:MOSC domain-containing protein YiiM